VSNASGWALPRYTTAKADQKKVQTRGEDGEKVDRVTYKKAAVSLSTAAQVNQCPREEVGKFAHKKRGARSHPV